MKIAITGAGGLLGVCATRYFAQHPSISRVNAFYAEPTEVPPSEPKLQVFVGDLRNDSASEQFVEGVDAVLHFAHRGVPADGHTDSLKVLMENLKMTGTLLDAMKKKGVKRILYASSADALYKYDPFKRVPHHEQSEIEYRSAYALSKFSTEHLLHYYEQSQGIRAVILRLSNIYCREELKYAHKTFIGQVLSKTQKKEPVTLNGGFDIYKDYLYVDDFLRALQGILTKKELVGTFNLGAGVGTTAREILTTTERVAKTKIKTQIAEKSPFETNWAIINTQKIQRTLNWGCHFSLCEGIRAIWSEDEPTAQPTKSAA